MNENMRIGQEAVEAKGWWLAHKWLVLRPERVLPAPAGSVASAEPAVS